MTFHEWGLLLALSILWGGSFFFNGVAVRELPTFTIVVGRVALASVALLLVLRVTGQQLPRNPRIWIAFGGDGGVEQRRAIQFDCLGTDTSCFWCCFNSQCDDTFIHSSSCAFYDLG